MIDDKDSACAPPPPTEPAGNMALRFFWQLVSEYFGEKLIHNIKGVSIESPAMSGLCCFGNKYFWAQCGELQKCCTYMHVVITNV